MARTRRHTKPGGWLEVQEFAGYIYSDDDSVAEDSIIIRFFETMYEAMTKFGANFRIVNELGPILAEIGYVNAVCKTIKVPIGTWPKVRPPFYFGIFPGRLRIMVESFQIATNAELKTAPGQDAPIVRTVHADHRGRSDDGIRC